MEIQWPLILFTTFLAWSAGLFATQAFYSMKGEGAKAQMTALIASVVLMAVGGIAVFFHLQHWERIFNGFGHITSGITQELIAIVVLFLCMVVYFVYLRRTGDEALIPKWLAIASIVLSVVLIIVAGHSYMMASRPAWNSIFQVLSLLGAGAALGPATMAVICAIKESPVEIEGNANFYGQIANAALVVIFVAAVALAGSSFTQVSYWFDITSPTQDITSQIASNPFDASSIGATLIAIIAAAAGVVCAYFGKTKGNWKVWGAAALACAFISALALRVMFYATGVSVYPFF